MCGRRNENVIHNALQPDNLISRMLDARNRQKQNDECFLFSFWEAESIFRGCYKRRANK